MTQFYTYQWLREDGTPYYVGKGKGRRAFVRHRGGNPPSKERIQIRLLPDEQSAFVFERFLIALHGRKINDTGILRNLTVGGEGVTGHKFSKESIQKLSDSHKGQVPWCKGRRGDSRLKWKANDTRRVNPPGKGVKHINAKPNSGSFTSDKVRAMWSDSSHREMMVNTNRNKSEENRKKQAIGCSLAWTPERKAAQAQRWRDNNPRRKK